LPKDIAEKYTTLTYGYDVAMVMAELIGNTRAYGEVFHIATEQIVKWNEVLELYLNVIEKELGFRPNVCMPDNSKEMGEICGDKYRIFYDRLYDRRFCNEKVASVVGHAVEYTDVYEGLTRCLTNYIHSEKYKNANLLGVRKEAYFDKLTNEKTSLKSFKSLKTKLAYILLRYTSVKI